MHEVLPNCDLLDVLRLKADARPDTTFDYSGHLRGLREHVAGEVRFINELFPEYTPHDDEYHLSRLFHVADTLIERGRFEEMQATELFVLACGLYAHDWGMAVSGPERAFVTTGVLPDGAVAADFAVLPDEPVRLRRFLADRGVDAARARTEGVSDDDWREYVRLTHAPRSAERVRRFFATIDPGAGEAVARVCEGHWLEFEKLHNHTLYPTAFSVLREPVNLAALAVYVRLVDLLDIAADRTPYVIWKFVAPRSEQSRMEWAKHRALQPVTCPPYQGGRLVRVDGSTEDHEVYAALEDLRIYCESQVRGCTDLLARLNDPRHRLDLYHVEWRVAARGFEPVPVRFEFDRERVFEILSDEIYQGDAHVFLRELLQNSIDAIRARREFLRRGGIAPQSFGLIRVEVEHGVDGNARVVWTDNGVGMDEYTVRNYLAVAGRSFYRSDDFRRLGLEMDPISRFGIGILSCFMVADEVEIETAKDPYAPPPGEPLRIRIPSVTRQFRVEKVPPGAMEVGTRVTVHVQGRRLPAESQRLQVTRYLKAVAGFVEFPILISEEGRHTLILHPYSDDLPATDPRLRDFPPETLDVHRLPLGFPLEDAVLPQDLEAAKAAFVERSYDLREDLGITTAEGRITLLFPRDPDAWMEESLSPSGVGISIHGTAHGDDSIVRWSAHWEGYDEFGDWSRSATLDPHVEIFRNGVLVAGAGIPARALLNPGEASVYVDGVTSGRQVINLISGTSPELDVSRTALRTDGDSWYRPIHAALESRLVQDLRATLQGASAEQRFARIGMFLACCHPSAGVFYRGAMDDFPVPFVEAGGRLEFVRWGDLRDQPVRICPDVLHQEVSHLLEGQVVGAEYHGLLSEWRGSGAVVAPTYTEIIGVDAALASIRLLFGAEYHLAGIELLTPPHPSFPPLIQEVWHRGALEWETPTAEIAAEVIADPLSVSARRLATLLKQSTVLQGHEFVLFPESARGVMRAAHIFNVAHPVSHLLLRCVAYVNSMPEERGVAMGRLRDAVEWYGRGTWAEQGGYPDAVAALFTAAAAVGIPADELPVEATPTVWYEDDIPIQQMIKRQRVQPFGMPLPPDGPMPGDTPQKPKRSRSRRSA